ncbi:replication-associated recombination protein A [Candidatus Mycoplasma pogonae]
MQNLNEILRPKTLNDILGQEHLKPLLQALITHANPMSVIFYGQSGVGKTSLALILAQNQTQDFAFFNAAIENKAALIEKMQQAKVLIIDEIHRLNRDKQDLLLAALEKQTLIVYATTTENPYFKVNPAIRSRMQILELQKIAPESMVIAVKKWLKEKTILKFSANQKVIEALVDYSSGDFRNLINNLSILNLIYQNKTITITDVQKVLPNINFYSDKNGDAHYNNLSAFHKSLRGSDVDAALYYGALIIKSGDIDGLWRRIMAVAYEDVGLANPNMGIKVQAAIQIFERLGEPEGYLPIGQIICELALSPKSNSTYLAFAKARQAVATGKIYTVPKHLQDSHYASASKLGVGVDYLYPHDYENHYVKQMYLPKELQGTKFYQAANNKHEQGLEKFWNQIKNK